MRKSLISLVLCGGILAASGAAILGAKAARNATQAAEKEMLKRLAVERVPNVRVLTVQPSRFEDRLVLTGNIVPWEEVWLSAEVGGKIEVKAVEQGDRVSKGQELLRVDTDALRLQLEQARTREVLAGRELTRIQNLRKDDISSKQNLDQATAEHDVASATVRVLDLQLAKSVLRAPFDGIVDTLMHEESEFVEAGRPLLHLVQVYKVKAGVGIPERDIANFAVGDSVAVSVDALPGREFTGTVYRIATTASPGTRTFASEIELDNADASLRAGMIARVRLVRKVFPDAITVPIFAVLPRQNGYAVFVEENGAAQIRDVEVGIFQNDCVLIPRGLSAGDRVIVAGQHDVQPGGAVRVMKEAAE